MFYAGLRAVYALHCTALHPAVLLLVTGLTNGLAASALHLLLNAAASILPCCWMPLLGSAAASILPHLVTCCTCCIMGWLCRNATCSQQQQRASAHQHDWVACLLSVDMVGGFVADADTVWGQQNSVMGWCKAPGRGYGCFAV
jgi:hypothetical protein